jgi:hypothetical protein
VSGDRINLKPLSAIRMGESPRDLRWRLNALMMGSGGQEGCS